LVTLLSTASSEHNFGCGVSHDVLEAVTARLLEFDVRIDRVDVILVDGQRCLEQIIDRIELPVPGARLDKIVCLGLEHDG
jgi:hypothetical protein